MKSFVILLLVVTFSTLAAAQTSDTGSGLKGTMWDWTGSVIPGLEVSATGKDGKIFKTTSGPQGEYSLEMPPGIYLIKVVDGGTSSAFCETKIRNYLTTKAIMSFDILVEAKWNKPRCSDITIKYKQQRTYKNFEKRH